jgi:hypothetical protein
MLVAYILAYTVLLSYLIYFGGGRPSTAAVLLPYARRLQTWTNEESLRFFLVDGYMFLQLQQLALLSMFFQLEMQFDYWILFLIVGKVVGRVIRLCKNRITQIRSSWEKQPL